MVKGRSPPHDLQGIGIDWCRVSPQIAVDFNRLSSMHRSDRALEARWRTLHTWQGNRSPLLSGGPTTASCPQSRPSLPFNEPDKSRHAAARGSSQRVPKAWTERETNILLDIMARYDSSSSWHQEICAAFYRALPTSTRSRSAIGHRRRLLERKQDEDEESSEHDDEDEEEVSVDDSAYREEATSVAQPPAEREDCAPVRSTSSKPTGAHPDAGRSQQQTGSSSTSFTSGTPSPKQWENEEDRHRHVPRRSRGPSPDVNMSFEYQPCGLIITNLPPGYEATIYSPTQFKIIRSSTATSASIAAAERPPAFNLKRLDDGSIQSVRLPEGTTTNLGATRLGGQQGDIVAVDTRFKGADGFEVRLRATL